jgi:ribosomal protein RSM22 (predicted rRNA methylase)
MRTVELPPALRAAAAELVSRHGAPGVRRARRGLTARYRDAEEAPGPRARTPDEIAAYAAARLPATYAAAHMALSELERGSFSPAAHLDLGAGLGSAVWAAASLFPSLREATAVDAADEMLRVGASLAAESELELVRAARWVRGDVTRGLPDGGFDLVTIAFVLNELAPADATSLVRAAWLRTKGALVLVEPGTPDGYRRVLEQRAKLLADGAATAAPCPHDLPCPLGEGDWCHFAVRVARTAEHRAAKDAELGHEDEKLSYVALRRDGAAPRVKARILRHPQVRKGHIAFELCTPDGLRRATVSKRDREAFRAARKLSWGDDLGELGY